MWKVPTAVVLVLAAPGLAMAQTDLQGVWTNGTLTPLERPPALADKAFYTEKEAAEQEQQAIQRRRGDEGTSAWRRGQRQRSVRRHRLQARRPPARPSLVVDPPDGRIPLRAEAEAKRDFNVANVDSFETMSPWDRCITRSPTHIFPAGYNNAYQIVQTPTHVVIMSEMIHEARVIPLDGRPHAAPQIQQWLGDSRGRWEGATLVIDTTNFHDRGWISTHAGSGRLRGVPHSRALHLVERLTRTDPNTILYQMTVEDPEVYERPWTFSMPLVRSDDYQIFEYACHEGNEATSLILRGARTLEREAAAAADKRD